MDTNNDGRSSEEKDPQIISDIPEERIQARRLRIQRRIEAARRRLIEEDSSEENTVCEEEKSLLEKQVESSTVALLALLEEGKELVTNVQVAGELYEVKRRVDETSAKEIRLKKLEEEAALALIKFKEINSKWEEIVTYNDPLDLHQETETQKEKCMQLIDQKDMLISDLKAELKAADIRFVKDQKKQSEDITLLVERIDSLVKTMKRTYRNELNLIEQAINTERKEIVEISNKHWETLYKERERDEVSNLEHRFIALNRHNELMNQVMIEHQEKFRATKISLESDIQVLQQQLEQMKAMCLLNKEKMEYNYQVLKKREEESLLIRSQQKRRINKLQDSVTKLRRRIQIVEQSMIAEEKRLRSEVVKLHCNIKEVQLKAEHFAKVNNTKYNQLWKFNDKSAKKLLDKILNIDRIIYEQHLGFPWCPPNLNLLVKTEMASYQTAMKKIKSTKMENFSYEEKYVPQSMVINNRLMRQILKAIANTAGYLVESKLLSLLKHYTEEEGTLVCLDNVFCALDLKNKEDIETLRKGFEPHIMCRTCILDQYFESKDSCSSIGDRRVVIVPHDKKDESEIVKKQEKVDTPKSEVNPILKNITFSRQASYASGPSLTMTLTSYCNVDVSSSVHVSDDSLREKLERHTEPDSMQEKAITRPAVCQNPDHVHYIESSSVLATLKNFVENSTSLKGRETCTLGIKDQETLDTVSRLLKSNDVKLYWARFREIFGPEKEKLWDCLMIGLSKYHCILQERHKVNKEVEHLKLQNSELKCLLQRYALPDNIKAESLKPTYEFLPPLTNKFPQISNKTPINLFLQITENKKKILFKVSVNDESCIKFQFENTYFLKI